MNTKKLVLMSLFAAISVVLVYLIKFPIFPAVPFLEYDPADVMIFICTFLFGPVSGLLVTLVVSIIQGITVSAGGGIIGIASHFVATGSFVVVAGLIYRKNKTVKRAVTAMVAGSLTMCGVMVLWNIIVLPIYTGFPLKDILTFLPRYIVPFNLIKAGINSVIAFMVYKFIFSSNTIQRLFSLRDK